MLVGVKHLEDKITGCSGDGRPVSSAKSKWCTKSLNVKGWATVPRLIWKFNQREELQKKRIEMAEGCKVMCLTFCNKLSLLPPARKKGKKKEKEKIGQIISVHYCSYYQMSAHLFLSGFLRNADVAIVQADSCLLHAVSTKGDRLLCLACRRRKKLARNARAKQHASLSY